MTARCVASLFILMASLGLACSRENEPGVSAVRHRLLAAGVRPTGLRTQLAGLSLASKQDPSPDIGVLARKARATILESFGDTCTRARDLAFLDALRGDFRAALNHFGEIPESTSASWCKVERAAYLAEVGDRELDATALLGAVVTAGEVTEEQAGFGIALYNRAEALELLGLRTEAARTWRMVEQAAPGALADHAGQRAQALSAPTPAELWFEFAKELAAHPTEDFLARGRMLVEQMPQAARELGCEVLLQHAAEAALRGDSDEARRILAVAELLGSLVIRREGDPTLQRVVEEVQGAIRGDAPQGEVLLLAVRDYGRACDLLRENRYDEAAAVLETATEALASAGSVLASWARFRLTVARKLFDPSRRSLAFEEQLAEAPADLPALRASLARSAAVAADFAGDPPRALAQFDQAEEAFERMGEAENLASVLSLRAFVCWDLGREADAGRDLLHAIRLRGRIVSPEVLQLVLDTWVTLVVSRSQPKLVRLYKSELLAAAEAGKKLTQIAQAHLVSGEDSTSSPEERLVQLNLAQQAAEGIPDSGERNRKLALVCLGRAKLLWKSNPGDGLRSAEEALALLSAVGIDPLRLTALRLRAQALHQLKRFDEAEDGFLEAIDQLERVLSRARSTEERMRTLLDSRQLFEDLAELRLDARQDFAGALQAIEWGRARSLLLAAGGAKGEAILRTDPARLAKDLPVGYELVEFAFLGEQLAVWHLGAGGLSFHLRPDERGGLREATQRLLDALSANSDAADPLLDRVGKDLLSGLSLSVGEGSTLVVVPDPELAAVPWGALHEPTSGLPLIFTRAIVTAPSASLFALLRDDGIEDARRTPRSLRALGNPSFSPTLLPGLAPLSKSAAEAMAISGRYESSEVLLADQATPAAAVRSPLPDVLHIAAHALAPATRPERASLVLAPDPAHPTGFWTTSEIMDSRLGRVSLVVLAACGTSRGPSYGPEGTLSLATAFLAAGVPSVVASLWPVDDAETARFMKVLHGYLAMGLTPREAIRRTQLDEAGNSRERPSNWSSFLLWGVR